MPDPEVAGQDTDQKVAQPGEVTASVPPAGADTGTPKMFFGKFKTEEEAEKAYKESESRMHAAAEEAKHAKEKIAQLEQQSQIADALKTLAESQSKKPEQPDVKTYIKSLSEMFREDPGKAAEEMTYAVTEWVQQGAKQAQGYADEQVKTVKAELAKLQDEVQKNDPFYQENQEWIEELRKDGLSFAKAKSFVKKVIKEKKAEIPAGQTPPASLSGNRIVQRTVDEPLMTKEEEAETRAEYSEYPQAQVDAMIERLKATRARRKARQEKK